MPRPVSRYKRRGVKLTQHQCYVFDKLKDGERIVKTILPDGSIEYALTSGYGVRSDTLQILLQSRFLESCGDGLFDDPQQWKLAPYSEQVAA